MDLPMTSDVQQLRVLAQQYGDQIREWEEAPPDEATRVSLLKSVLDLNVAVMQHGSPPRNVAPDSEESDEFPRAIVDRALGGRLDK